jgi:hypothetical protein
MDSFLLPFIFSFLAAISFLLLLQQLLPATILFTASLFKQVIQWLLLHVYSSQQDLGKLFSSFFQQFFALYLWSL